MNTGNLDGFLSGGFITILAAGVIVLILKHWKGAEWLKIGSVIFIALILQDFAVNQGKNTFAFVRWALSLFGIKM
ncbi:hypothetical protein EA94_01166 [Enterococcus faecalis]|uniref:hypothetical protein n=1 Tax=Enterococcus faecalis TaxID=1351 RepID=UPI000DE98522|nr:hypothetical protein [Enterococcus faecalis]EKQ3612494.1 hypothetical protein [Enterococcus faecalis]RBS17132.1 hypothetical protein EA94_01166 [Enterococcus faecalis]